MVAMINGGRAMWLELVERRVNFLRLVRSATLQSCKTTENNYDPSRTRHFDFRCDLFCRRRWPTGRFEIPTSFREDPSERRTINRPKGWRSFVIEEMTHERKIEIKNGLYSERVLSDLLHFLTHDDKTYRLTDEPTNLPVSFVSVSRLPSSIT